MSDAKKVVCFGEVMGRLAPDQYLRFSQVCPGLLDLTFAGAEANVAVSISLLGGRSSLVSALPKHDIAEACVRQLRGLGVDTRHLLRTDEGRMGLYFVETGCNQRPTQVIYDRSGSSVALASPDSFRWEEAFADASWFHVTGITPALSREAAAATRLAVERATDAGLSISCDLNFRKKLWTWDRSCQPRELAEKTMREILPLVHLVIANEQDAADVLNIHAGGTDVESGRLAIDRYPEVAAAIGDQFPNVDRVAITLRESISASHNNWGAMLWNARSGQIHFAPTERGNYRPYEIRDIVDRVGAGDAFAAGLIFALLSGDFGGDEEALRFAAASSCLAHSIHGDFNYTTRGEAESLMAGSGSGRVVR